MAQVGQLPQVFLVELAAIIVSNRPNRADGFAFDVERNQQGFVDSRRYRQEIGVAALDVSEQQRDVAIEHVAAGTEIAGRAAADVGNPYAGDRGPVETLAVFHQEADAG